MPDISRCVSTVDVNALARDHEKLDAAEGFLRDTRIAVLKHMGKCSHTALNHIRPFEKAIIRLSMSKQQVEFKGVAACKFTEDKMIKIREAWLKRLAEDDRFTNLAELAGIELRDEEEDEDDEVP